MQFSYYMPTRLLFGAGQFAAAGAEAAKLGQRALIVTGRDAMARLGFTQRLRKMLDEAGVANMLFDGVSPEPLAEEVDDCVAKHRGAGIDLVVALGGGSAIDAAKGICLGLTVDGSVIPYLLGEIALPEVKLPLLAIPTTAGTGSEANRAAILTAAGKQIKTSFRHESLFPLVALLDPELTFALSPEITRDTGFDIFAHAVETYISRAAFAPQLELHSLEAVSLLRRNLPQAVREGANCEARSALLYASMLMGCNLANSTTCLPHRLQYPVGLKTASAHGRGLRALMRPWLELAYEYSPQKFERIGAALGAEVSGKTAFLTAYDEFVAASGLQMNLTKLGIGRDDVPLLVKAVHGNLANDPAAQAENIVEKIYYGAV